MDERARRLFEAHVAHELARLRGPALERLIEDRLAAVFAWFDELRLSEAVRCEDVVALTERYALDLRVSGGISELAGEMARLVVNSAANAEATAGDVVSSESFEEFAEKIAGLDDVRAEILALFARSEALGAVTARVVAHVLTDLLRRGGERVAVGPAAGLAPTLERRIWPRLEARTAAVLWRVLEEHRHTFAAEVERHLREALDAEALLAIGEELWLHISRLPLSEVFSFIGEQDLEDFVVLVFEFWLRFRKTAYLRRILSEAIGFFFEKYGDESVSDVIAEMGVAPAMIENELKLLLVPLAERAFESGVLERLVRRHLQEFYASDALREALS